jgi:hypothetical protein
MIVTLLLLQLASAAWPIAEAPQQNTRARVALLLSDSDTSARRWMSISLLDSLLPGHLAKRRLQYISRHDVLSVTDQDAGPPLTWTDEDALALGALFRATFMVELRVSHTPAREDVCARVLRVHERTTVDSVCVQNTGSMRRAVSQLAPDLGRRLNRLSRVPAAPKRPHLTRVGADGAAGKRPRAATVGTRIRVVRAPAAASI